MSGTSARAHSTRPTAGSLFIEFPLPFSGVLIGSRNGGLSAATDQDGGGRAISFKRGCHACGMRLTKIRSPPLAGRCLRADQAEDDHGNAYSADGARDLADRA